MRVSDMFCCCEWTCWLVVVCEIHSLLSQLLSAHCAQSVLSAHCSLLSDCWLLLGPPSNHKQQVSKACEFRTLTLSLHQESLACLSTESAVSITWIRAITDCWLSAESSESESVMFCKKHTTAAAVLLIQILILLWLLRLKYVLHPTQNTFHHLLILLSFALQLLLVLLPQSEIMLTITCSFTTTTTAALLL